MIGSMVPDFGYFIREFGMATFAHTIVGAFCGSVPVGLVFYFLATLCFRRIAEALPQPHAGFVALWQVSEKMAWPHLAKIVIAILAGALSHNLVDSFTHESGLAVSIFPLLRTEMFSIKGEPFPLFRILQYFGSALGMAIIFVSYFFALQQYCQCKRVPFWQDRRRWMFHLSIVTLTLGIAFFLNVPVFDGDQNLHVLRTFLFKFLITWLPLYGMTFLCLALFQLVPFQREQH